MAIMKAFFLLLTIWIHWLAIVNLVSALAPRRPPPPPRAPPPPPPIKKTLTFNLDQPTTYRKFITDLRNELAEKDDKNKFVLKCGMQKISKVPPPERFMYVELIVENTKKVTLALDLSNAYVIGYMDKFNNKDRAFFFKEFYTQTNLIANVFPTTKTNDGIRLNLGFDGNYIALENGGDRNNTPLGIFTLNNDILGIYGKNIDQNKQRKFLLTAVQMVSEATRFTYISDRIPQDEFGTLTVDDKVIALENGWGKLSNAVYKSVASTTAATKCALKNSVSLTSGGKVWTFDTVEKIKEDVGILNAEGTMLFTYNDDNEDNNTVKFW